MFINQNRKTVMKCRQCGRHTIVQGEWHQAKIWCPNCSEEEGVDPDSLSDDVLESRQTQHVYVTFVDGIEGYWFTAPEMGEDCFFSPLYGVFTPNGNKSFSSAYLIKDEQELLGPWVTEDQTEKIRRRARDLLNKTTDTAAILECARQLDAKID